MGSEVFSVFLALAVTVFLPGWFWSKCLCGSLYVGERLVYSMALSITLVPAVVLTQDYLFGSGVTLSRSVLSIVIVFLAGLLCFVAFGSAQSAKKPIARLQVPLGPLALTPITIGFALVSAALISDEPLQPWMVLLVGSLVIISVVAYLFETRGETSGLSSEGDDARPQGSRFTPLVHYLSLATVLTLVLFRSYAGPWKYDWPFPHGVDSYQHAVMIRMMLTEGTTESFMLYPPGLHLLGAVLSRISGLDPLTLLPFVAPALLLLPALACYALASRLWGWEYGIAAAFCSGVIINGTYQYADYARYPSLVGDQFLFVLLIALFVGFFLSPSVRHGVLLAVLGSSVVLYHQVGSFYEVLLLGLLSILFVPYLLFRRQKIALVYLLSLGLLGVLSAFYAWSTYDLPTLVSGLLTGSDSGQGGEAVAMAIGTKGAPPFSRVVDLASQPVLWLGFLGIMLVAVDPLRRPGTSNVVLFAVLFTWSALFLVGASTKYSGFPDRFAQDASIPLAVLAAFSSIIIFRSLLYSSGVTSTLVSSLAVLVVGGVIAIQAAQNLRSAAEPGGRGVDSRPPAQVAVAGRWLKQHNNGGNIVVTPRVRFVPFRSILAMGHYTGMQSYKIQKIRRSRDIPPFGKKPLWDAQWVLHHPTGRRTERILRDYDVRRIVIDKDYPGVRWRSFESLTDRYRLSFENDYVAILTPRKGR